MNKYILLSLFSLYIPAAQAETCEGLLGSENYAKAAEIGRTDKNFAGLMCLGKVLSAQNKHNDALQSFTDAENTAANGFEQVMAVIFQARANRDAGQTQQAYSQYQRGFELAVTHKIRQGQLVVLNEPGQMLLDAHDSKAALERFQKASPLAANDNERAEVDELMAAAYRQLADYDHAVEYQLRGTNLERRSGDLNHYLYATLELAAIRTEAKEYNAAQKNIEEALDQAKSANSSYWQAKTLLYQGRLEKAKGNANQAAVLFNQASTLAATVGEPSLIGDISQELKQGK